MDSIIEDVQVRKILDSRGNPTIEVDIVTWNGFGRAAAPSGASTGSREVVSFPEGGVDLVVREMEDFIASELIGMDAEDIATIDEVLKEKILLPLNLYWPHLVQRLYRHHSK